MSVSLYLGIAFFLFFALLTLLWSIFQCKNQKDIEEMFDSRNGIHDPRNGVFYVTTQYNTGRGGNIFDLGYSPNHYENADFHERHMQHAGAPTNFNSFSRSISPPAYETFIAIDLEVPPSYEECSKLGYV